MSTNRNTRIASGRPAIGTSVVLLVLGMLFAAGLPMQGQQLSELSLPAGGNGRSQRGEVSQWIGPVRISIDYHSPSLHGRAGHIWGELVPFGLFDDGHGPSKATPWRAGANETTTISFSHDVKVEGQDVKAGTYGLFLELAKAGPWTWILSTISMGWGSYQYDRTKDVLRAPVTPQTAPLTEFLTYGFDDRAKTSAVAFLQWETKRVPLRIEVPDVNEVYVAEMRKELLGWPGFRYQNWQAAAQFCADAKINLDEALTWADKAISEPFRGATIGREEFSTLRTKAAVLEAMGRDSEAAAIMEKALGLPRTAALELHFYASRLLASGKKEKALEVFELNQRRHPEERFWTYLGLARGYAAVGNQPQAIKNWQIALLNVPDSEQDSVPEFERALHALQAGK